MPAARGGGLGVTDGGEHRRGVHRARYAPVVGTHLPAGKVGGDDTGLVVGRVSERRDAGDVADGPEVLGPDHPAALVDLDRLARVDVQPQRLQAKPGGTGPAPRGQDHPVGIDEITTDEGQAGASSGTLRRCHLLAEQHPDTDSTEPLGHRRRRLWLLARDKPDVALDDGDLASKHGEEIGKLTPDRAPPMTATDRGCSLVLIACSLVQAGTVSRPGTWGTSGVEPVFRTRSRYWTRVPSTSTTPGWTMRPVPRNSLAPVFCNATAVELSLRPWTIRSLRAAACR
jgi:hypothetical protein